MSPHEPGARVARPRGQASSPILGVASIDMRPLGVALKARTGDVLKLTGARIRALGHGADAVVQGSFERFNESSTTALALWLAGEKPPVGRPDGKTAWRFYGELAAHRAASLQEVTERCLCWRDSVAEVLRDSGAELGVAPEVLTEALDLTQRALEFCLVQMCRSFDSERRRTDEQLARREAELTFQATHDALTGLPNRTLLLDRVEQMLARSVRNPSTVAALHVDLDNFKSVNDTLGRAAGDELLLAVAQRLDGALRTSDTLGRLGGDEFVALCEDESSDAGPELIADRLRGALEAPFALGGECISVSASIGVAVGGHCSAEELLRGADAAMHRAKWDGKNRCTLFEAAMQDTIQERAELELDLRVAVEREELFLLYQPTFALSDLSPTGVEALIRWRHPARGIVPPVEFIPLAEETGLITKIGRWVLKRACADAAAWREAGLPIGIAVNVSARQLDSDELLADIASALSEAGLESPALTLEITETALMRNVEETVGRLLAIKQLGARIAIDDFGTGYSSLSHVRQFPIDALKIDRSFVAGADQSPDGQTFIRTLVQLGKALSIETIAEGIEREEQLSRLREQDCDGGQGFLYARPLDAGDVGGFIRRASLGPRPLPSTATDERTAPVAGSAGT